MSRNRWYLTNGCVWTKTDNWMINNLHKNYHTINIISSHHQQSCKFVGNSDLSLGYYWPRFGSYEIRIKPGSQTGFEPKSIIEHQPGPNLAQKPRAFCCMWALWGENFFLACGPKTNWWRHSGGCFWFCPRNMCRINERFFSPKKGAHALYFEPWQHFFG